MNIELQIAQELLEQFSDEHFNLEDRTFELARCTNMVKEHAAQAYFEQCDCDDQIDVLVEALQSIQSKEGQTSLAVAFYGSPLKGVLSLRTEITEYVVRCIGDSVDSYMSDLIDQRSQAAAEDHAYQLTQEAAL